MYSSCSVKPVLMFWLYDLAAAAVTIHQRTYNHQEPYWVLTQSPNHEAATQCMKTWSRQFAGVEMEHQTWEIRDSDPEEDGLQQGETTLVALPSAKKRNMKLQLTQAHQRWTIEGSKMLPGLTSLIFTRDIQKVRLAAASGVMVWGIISWHI